MPKIVMAHNVVILKLGTDQVKFITAGAQARETDFISNDMKEQVIAKTPLAGAGETVEVMFKVPNVAGVSPRLSALPPVITSRNEGEFRGQIGQSLVVSR